MAAGEFDSGFSLEDDTKRMQLWSIYFGLRSLSDPPPFLADARRDLWELLDGQQTAPGRHLHLVPGDD